MDFMYWTGKTTNLKLYDAFRIYFVPEVVASIYFLYKLSQGENLCDPHVKCSEYIFVFWYICVVYYLRWTVYVSHTRFKTKIIQSTYFFLYFSKIYVYIHVSYDKTWLHFTTTWLCSIANIIL